MDEDLVPHAQRLRIRRSNFRLLSGIKSKESTLQLIYDVLLLCPFFKAFLVEHKNSKKSNEMYYPRFMKVIIHHFMSKDLSIPRRNKVQDRPLLRRANKQLKLPNPKVYLPSLRTIIIQRRVEDLQLGVESYQKKLNLTKPDSYRSDLKRKEAYTAYSNPRGFIYQNKDKKNRLMRIDELHKFSDGTLTDVRNALDDRLKGIQM
uniref:Uncharacterized protein n=1 Tax=Tanacetum cinerariifolium TaxID=118510 RepID=A0A699J0X3_TANCI|nr:hypothetical protein [Tanacetum cinerariifolium]